MTSNKMAQASTLSTPDLVRKDTKLDNCVLLRPLLNGK